MKSQIINSRSQRGFTLVELLVAVAIMAIVLGAMGVIFRMSMDAYRASSATAEIMRKLRAVTEQLDSDFKGLRQSDGTVFIVWAVTEPDPAVPYLLDGQPRYHREDRIVFFANGDFQSYRDQASATGPKQVRGNVARISYMLARDKDGYWPENYTGINQPGQAAQRDQRRRTRILARSQHIVTADPDFAAFPDFATIATSFVAATFIANNNLFEYDTDGLSGWKNAPIDPPAPYGLNAMLRVCTGIEIGLNGITSGGLQVDPDKPDVPASGVQLMLVEGARDLKIQGCLDGPTGLYRWFPETGNADPAGVVSNSDFFTTGTGTIDTTNPMYAVCSDKTLLSSNVKNQADLPTAIGCVTGLGRAVKFTFTLYDSRGFFRDGRTFTHIVYLGDNQ